MNYSAPAFAAAPLSAAAPASITKIIIIIAIVVVAAIVVFFGIVAIALGVGLGIGLRKSDSPISKLSPPVVNCDAGTATCGCPTTKPIFSARIISGDVAASNSWPWMVYLTVNTTRICSGFIISRRHVLTASSCVTGVGNNITVSYGINTFQSSLGGANVSNSTFLTDVFDSVAVVTLGINFTFSASVSPCCLTGDASEPAVGQRGVIAGWGETANNNFGTPATTLQQAVIQVLNPAACSISPGDYQFCAGFGSISACPIDTGGPIMTNAGSAWTCAGIITGTKAACINPITFTRIAPYLPFIRNITALPF